MAGRLLLPKAYPTAHRVPFSPKPGGLPLILIAVPLEHMNATITRNDLSFLDGVVTNMPNTFHILPLGFITSHCADIVMAFPLIYLYFLCFHLGILSLGALKGYHPVFQNTGKVNIAGNHLHAGFNVHLEQTKLIPAILLGFKI